MPRSCRWVLALCVLAVAAEAGPGKILFLTHSAGYRHAVVKRPAPDTYSLAERKLIAAAAGVFEVVATQDCRSVTAESLEQYAAVVFYTSGKLPLNPKVITDYVRRGGGFVGIHSAADTFYDFAPYGKMVGGYFNGHPWHQEVHVVVEDKTHPATRHLGEAFYTRDEIYQFRNWSRDDVHVLLRLDVKSVDMNKDGVRRRDNDFALAWCKSHGAGRVFYTSLGHRADVWESNDFLKHVLGGIRWAAEGPMTDDEGFVTLYDGSSTEGWKQAGAGGFRHKDGVASAHGGMGLWYYEKTYQNFTLKVDFRTKDAWSNSGVFVRFPRVDGDPWIPVKEGHEIQIYGDKPGKSHTGSVYTVASATRLPIKQPGEWNEYEITCIGPRYWVRLNGELITTHTSDRSLEGMIGLQNHNAEGKGEVSFRNVRIKELPRAAAAYHVLLDGIAQGDGWRMCGPGAFRSVDGTLMATGGMGMLWHETPFSDFILMLDWQATRAEDNSGVFVRFPDPKNDPWVAVNQGYEIQICDGAKAKHRTGSIYSFQDSTAMPVKAIGAWNHYEISVIGQRYTIRINGKLVNEFTGSRSRAGHIGIQNHDDGSPVRFRNIRVVALK